MWLDNQQVQRMFRVNLYATGFNLGTESFASGIPLWIDLRWHRRCCIFGLFVHDISQGMLLFALMFYQSVCVCDRTRQTLIS